MKKTNLAGNVNLTPQFPLRPDKWMHALVALALFWVLILPDAARATNIVSGTQAFIGNGDGNRASGAYTAVVGGFGNKATGRLSFVGGGTNNTASGFYSTVCGGRQNLAGTNIATVACGRSNRALGIGAFIGAGDGNLASDQYAVVAGGYTNIASGVGAVVSGGGFDGAPAGNLASGPVCVIGGGIGNIADNYACTISGGNFNTASGAQSFLGGGARNVASGMPAMGGGGVANLAGGNSSCAGGQSAAAVHDGSFVWADNSNPNQLFSSADNSFNVRAAGGTRIFSNPNGTAGVQLAAGGNAWSVLSDRNIKENFAPVDPRAVLEKVNRMPITEWNLKSQDKFIRHVGPMAQDFHEAFGLGEDSVHISTSDADGVVFAAIQGLHQWVEELRRQKDSEIAELRRQNTALAEQLIEIKAKMQETGAQMRQ